MKLRQSVSTTSPENYFAVDVFQNLPYMAKPEAPPFQQFSAFSSSGVTEKYFCALLASHVSLVVSLVPLKSFYSQRHKFLWEKKKRGTEAKPRLISKSTYGA